MIGMKCAPGVRPEKPGFINVMHVHRDTQHGSQRYQLMTDMSVADRSVVGAPGGHYRIDVFEMSFAGKLWNEPGGGPGLIGALVQCLVNGGREIDGRAFGDL